MLIFLIFQNATCVPENPTIYPGVYYTINVSDGQLFYPAAGGTTCPFSGTFQNRFCLVTTFASGVFNTTASIYKIGYYSGIAGIYYLQYSTMPNSVPAGATLPCPYGGSPTTVLNTNICAVASFSTPKAMAYSYVINTMDYDQSISIYSVNSSNGLLSPLTPASIATSLGPWSAAIESTGRFVYTADPNNNKVSMYSINQSNGLLSALSPSTVTTGSGPSSIAIEPTGRFVYVANNASNSISMFAINSSSGLLTQLSPSTVAVGPGAVSVAIDPTGRFVYVTGSSVVSMYSINSSSGVLSPLSPSTVPAGSNPCSITVDPTGRFAYVANDSVNPSVSMYSINANTGVLTPLTPATVSTTGTSPSYINVDPSGRFAYVNNAGGSGNAISIYNINQTSGVLSPVSFSIPGLMSLMNFAIDPTGHFIYVPFAGDNGSISMFSINQTSGALAPLSPSSVSAGDFPGYMFNMSGAFHLFVIAD